MRSWDAPVGTPQGHILVIDELGTACMMCPAIDLDGPLDGTCYLKSRDMLYIDRRALVMQILGGEYTRRELFA